jgi:phosphomannomutase
MVENPVYYIFRSYDIRGVYNRELTEGVMKRIGNALGHHIKNDTVVVGRDARLSSRSLSNAFIDGVVESGKNVIDAGELPKGVCLFFSTFKKLPCAYVTGSHLDPEWNGIGFYDESGVGFSERENYHIRDIVIKQKPVSGKKNGSISIEKNEKIIEKYKNYLNFRIKSSRKMRIVIDCGNGTAGIVVADLFKRAGHDVCVIFEKPDGNFPNRPSDPDEKNLERLSELVKGYDFGLAFDGDSDRVVVMDNSGKIITPEQLVYIIIDEIAKQDRGMVIANIECTKLADMAAQKVGKKIIRIPVGHTFMVKSVSEKFASLGIESSGHYCIRHILPFDDGVAVGLYFTMVMSKNQKPVSDITAEIPSYPFERIGFKCPDEKKFILMKKLKTKIKRQYSNIITADGIRIEFKQGWVLIRASNTSPLIRLTIEAETNDELERLKKKFSDILKKEIRS